MQKKIVSLTVPLLILLSAFSVISVLSANKVVVNAAPTSPYIAVTPAKTMDPTLVLGKNYTVSIYTDYSGNDVWCWQFELFYNPNVLEGVEVVNGDLITTAKDPSARFIAGKFNNTLGVLSMTSAYFFYTPPSTPKVTSGPGTLAKVTFRVKTIGVSNIILGENSQLLDAGENKIIDAYFQPDQIGHGYFHNIRGDLDGDLYVGPVDLNMFAAAYGKSKGQSGYNPLADLDGDGYVGPVDLNIFAAAYGKRYKP